ncbi:hypothetical protein [Nonomuraea sp. NPDC003201]
MLEDFDTYLAEVDRNVELIKVFSGGFSGAQVLLVRDRVARSPQRQHVLKFCPDAAEPDRIFVTYSGAPTEFARHHLAKPLDKVQRGRCAAVFMEVAGQDLANCLSLADHLDRPDLATICRTIVSSLLEGWNAHSTNIDTPLTVAEYFRLLLGEARLNGDGPLATFAARTGVDPRAETVRLPGWDREMRNPLTLADPGTLGGASRLPGGALIGDGHGDLNVSNLLIPGYPSFTPERYQIIDYGGHGTERPITWDPMYLLVSIATRWLGHVNPGSDSARGLVRVLARHRDREAGFGLSEHRTVVKAVYEAGYEWVLNQSYGDRWLPQCALSLCAAGLIFIGRRVPGVDTSLDHWFFELAAEAAEDFAEQVDIPTGVVYLTSYRKRRNEWPNKTSGDTAEFVRLLEETEFADGWADLRRGTRDLRAYLGEEHDHTAGSPYADSIRSLVCELRQALEDATDASLEKGPHERATRRAERIKRTLLALLAT